MKKLLSLSVSLLLPLAASLAVDLAKYNVVWDSPSKDSLDSMPLSGRMGAGANVWVESGSIWIYPSHNGAYDENGRLLKLGCLRITPVGFRLGGAGFKQELHLANGTITISQGDVQVALWFAGETLLFESRSAKPLAYDVAFGTWRDRKRDGILVDVFESPRQSFMPDQVQPSKEGFVWFHRNADTPMDLAAKAKRQGIPPELVRDLTTKRVFGGAAVVEGGISEPQPADVEWQFWNGKAWTGRTPARENLVVAVRLGGKLEADPQQWASEARALLDPTVRQAAKADESKRWDEFWSRSHLAVNPSAAPADEGWMAGRNYQLFRYMLACNRGGEFPLLFNGGIFTTDNKPGRITSTGCASPLSAEAPSSPDYRRWLFCHFMSQNQRWLGWHALANGDADLLEPSMAFYRDRSAIAAARAKANGAQGVVYPEPIDLWGLCAFAPTGTSLCAAPHLAHYFSMTLENAWMALQAHDALGISLEKDLPWIEGTVLFYDSFYRDQNKKRTGSELTADGKLLIYPSNALEYGGGATDPLEVLCALQRITAGLLAQPDLPADSRERMQRIQATIPDLPIGKRQGRASLFPARSIEQEFNHQEPCEMYAAWPYRLVGVTKPETLQLARDSWETIPEARAKICKQDHSWMPTVANVASIAMPAEAKKRAIHKMANNSAPQARFPAFFGPGHDWIPDHNWGGSGMVGMQEMLLAPEPGPTGKLHLFPAWPKDWDVDFKLHAPGPTIVEGVLKGGKLESLKVTPESRAKDIVNWLDKETPYDPPKPDDTGFENPKPSTTPSPAASESPEQRNARMAWWREARFGMFVHWGLYSGLAGNWKGKAMATPGYPNTEWMQHMAGADTATYAAEAVPKFKPTADFAKAWAHLAKQTGCQYVVFTTKHHEGFALHDSKFSDFDAGDVLHRDLVKEITDALHEEGLKVGFYHSLIDWHHPDFDFNKAKGLPYPSIANPNATPRDHAHYIDFLHNQVDELISNYGKVDVIWWDFSSKEFQGDDAWQATGLMKKIQAKQPGVIMNNRLFSMPEHGDLSKGLDLQHGDFVTPEQVIPANGLPGTDWESCMTLNKTWGYNESDHEWKSSSEIIRNLIDIASKGGNYLLNIGPKGDGTIPEETVTCLTGVGKWMDVNAGAIRGTTATPFPSLPWGRCTTKKNKDGTTLYLHVFDWPKDGKLLVPGLQNEVKSATLLADGKGLKFKKSPDGLMVDLPAEAPDSNATVIKLEVSGEPKVTLKQPKA